MTEVGRYSREEKTKLIKQLILRKQQDQSKTPKNEGRELVKSLV